MKNTVNQPPNGGVPDVRTMDLETLWALHIEVADILSLRIKAEREVLEKRLLQLKSRLASRKERRYYPPVLPKYRNPDKPSETWAGRGRQPVWLRTKLKAGRRIEDFAIRVSRRRSA